MAALSQQLREVWNLNTLALVPVGASAAALSLAVALVILRTRHAHMDRVDRSPGGRRRSDRHGVGLAYALRVARAIGINHVALEVGDVDEALTWYARFFEFELRGRRPTMAWIDLGDQFLALSSGRRQGPDEGRHFGLVVDDKEAVRAALADAGVDVAASGGLRFDDPWGNTVEVVDYRDVQFTKAPAVLAALAPEGLEKRAAAREELARKGLAG